MQSGKIRAGMGGWTFEPWDTSFYPDKLAKAKQLGYASRQVPTIEVNGTYYSTFKPNTFAKWAAESPDGFVFSLKAIRFSTNRRVLAEAGESVERFLGSGVSELGDKLGPILWQFAPTCYKPKALDEWAVRAKLWAEGKAPDDLPRADPSNDAPVKPRDVFVYFITSGKVRAPHGAMAFMERVGK